MSRSLDLHELFVDGLDQLPLIMEDGDPEKYVRLFFSDVRPFAKWIVFQRKKPFSKKHGVKRFSLLHICADGVATFKALYYANNLSPLAIAIIQPGHGFGMNWTDFTDQKKIFAKIVLNNPHGKPKYLLYGGIGEKGNYQKPCWDKFSNGLGFLPRGIRSFSGDIGVWGSEPKTVTT